MSSKAMLVLGCAALMLGLLAATDASAQATCSEQATCPKAATCAQAGAGEWIPLFDGKDLEGWQNARDPKAENKWFVEDGAMTNQTHANDIGTTANYKDFELSLEYKLVKDGNSGVYLRGRVEIQILDSYGKQEVGKGDNGAIYDKFVPLVNASKPAGEWNQLDACYVGDTLCVKLNGQVVQAKTKITEVTGGALPGGVDEAGPIMLQGDHGKIWFRNIKVRPLPEDACAAGACPYMKK